MKEKFLIYGLAFLMMLVTAYSEEGVIADEYQVVDVIDGDTIDVWMNGQEVRVRLLGVDTPETVRPGSPVECFGKESSKYTESMLLGEIVYLETDPSQAEYDRYGRLLAYVYIGNSEISFNKILLEEGYASMYKNNIPIKYEEEFLEAERLARKYNKGLWGADCLIE